MRYPCDNCGYAATKENDLKRHKEIKHKEVKYPCNKCEYVATCLSYLKQHNSSNHKGLLFPWNKYDHAATRESDFKIYFESKLKQVKRLTKRHKRYYFISSTCESLRGVKRWKITILHCLILRRTLYNLYNVFNNFIPFAIISLLCVILLNLSPFFSFFTVNWDSVFFLNYN